MPLTVDIREGIATITLNRPRTLNALTVEDYDLLATSLRDIDAREDVLVTVWQAQGRWFCAGTDVKNRQATITDESVRQAYLSKVASTTTDCGQALYSHRKILVAALNGPVIGAVPVVPLFETTDVSDEGIAAAFLGHFDFIYSLPDAWLSVPFTFLGIIAEGGSSASFVNRMGVAKANELLLWGKKKGAKELLECGFINEIFPSQPVDLFHAAVRKHLLEELRDLDPAALLEVRRLLRQGLKDKNDPDAVNMRESYAQAARFASGIPSQRFAKIASKEIRHKL